MMPRYYFNMIGGEGRDLIRDSDGVVLSDPRSARKEAVALARDIAKHGFQGPTETWKIVVTDENAEQLLILPLSEIPAKSPWTWLESRWLIARCRHFFCPGPSARFAAAAGLGIVIQAALLTGLMIKNLWITNQAVTYQIASAPGTSAPIGDAIVAVRFVSPASPQAIGEFLERYKAVIIDSPRAGGFYRLRLADAQAPGEELGKTVTRMMGESIVELVAVVE